MKSLDKVKFSLFLLSIFLIILAIHLLLLLGVFRRDLYSDIDMRLRLAGEIVTKEIDLHRSGALSDPYLLYSLGDRFLIDRITIFDPEGNNIADSAGTPKAGNDGHLFGIPGIDLRKVVSGETIISPAYKDEAGRNVRSIYLPLKEGEGVIKNIVRLSLKVRTAREREESFVTYYLLRVFGSVMVFVFAYYYIRTLIISQRRATILQGKQDSNGKTGFMIETFHSLIQKLKEKEQALERLRTEAEEKAEYIESYNEDILRSVTSGVITFSRERIVTTFNTTAEGILGINREEAIGKTCEDLFGSGKISQILNRSMEQGRGVSRQEFELAGRDNKKIWVGISTSLLKDMEERVIGITFLFTDLTEIKRLQEELRLKDRLTVLGEMSAGIAHEFRNYMGTILGFSRLLSKKMEKDDPRQGIVEAIKNELRDMDRLIDELLGFGRKAELNLQSTVVERLINRSVMPVIEQAKEPRLDIKIDIEKGIPDIMVDEVLMRQAIGNIVKNAVEAMQNGGSLEIKAKMAPKTKKIEYGWIEIYIADTGGGIPKEKLDKIFLPFFTTKEKGTGLGLALTQKIIVSHNGRIEVESQEGKGSIFRLYLPLKED